MDTQITQTPPAQKNGRPSRNSPRPNPIAAPARALFRPILFLALGVHALLLFAPLMPAAQRKRPEKIEEPVKITQEPTQKPVPAKPATQTPPKPTTVVKPTVAVATRLTTSTTGSTSGTTSGLGISTLPTTPNTGLASLPKVTPLPPGTPGSASTGSASSDDAATPDLRDVDPAQALYELLAELPVYDRNDPAISIIAQTNHFAQPNLFFKQPDTPSDTGDAALDLIPEPLPGLDNSPLVTVGEEPTFFYSTFFEEPLASIFETVTKVGEYAGGPLYELKRGNYTAFLNLVPAQNLGQLGTIVAVWKTDPRSQ